jgi:hypothetical protein
VSNITIWCDQCDLLTVVERALEAGCPNCGLTSFSTTVALDTGTIGITGETLTIRCVNPEKTATGRRSCDRTLKTQLFHAAGRVGDFDQEADRRDPDPANWRWRKRVVDHETGAVLWDAGEPLSEHQGHGSAKPTNS